MDSKAERGQALIELLLIALLLFTFFSMTFGSAKTLIRSQETSRFPRAVRTGRSN